VNRESLNVSLRRVMVDDAEMMLRWRSQASTRRFQASPKRTLDEVRDLLSQQAAATETSDAMGRLGWIILLNGDAVGHVQLTINPWEREHSVATLGYMVADEHQRKGTATAAVRLVSTIGFNTSGLALERIEAVAAVENVASRRVLEKAGYTFEGILRGLLRISGRRVDHACYGLLSTDQESQEK